MSRTIWLAFFGLIGMGPAIAIMVAAPASLVVERAQHQSEMKPAFALNESAKSDRLELPNAGAVTEITVPATKLMPADTQSTGPPDGELGRGTAVAKCPRHDYACHASTPSW